MPWARHRRLVGVATSTARIVGAIPQPLDLPPYLRIVYRHSAAKLVACHAAKGPYSLIWAFARVPVASPSDAWVAEANGGWWRKRRGVGACAHARVTRRRLKGRPSSPREVTSAPMGQPLSSLGRRGRPRSRQTLDRIHFTPGTAARGTSQLIWLSSPLNSRLRDLRFSGRAPYTESRCGKSRRALLRKVQDGQKSSTERPHWPEKSWLPRRLS